MNSKTLTYLFIVLVLLPILTKKTVLIILDEMQKDFIKDLHPKAKETFSKFISEVEATLGGKVIITSGYRDFKKQAALHASNPSNAKPGRSKHNYGLAIDINFMKNGKLLKKASSKKEWGDSGVVAIAKKYGLKWGGDFVNYHDPVHFEMKNPTTDVLYNLALQQYGSNLVNMQGNTLNF